ncbi:hypothetical protein GW17_00019247 [Ensete ventricosum]|nr:hypothetical protein GW17_00019247 [Ensete ventricosum]
MGPARTPPRTRCRSRGVLELRGGLESRVRKERCGCFGKQSGRGNPLAPPPFRRCEMQRHVMPGQNEKEKTDACADTTSGDWQLSVSGVIWRSPFIPSACSKLEEDSTCQIRHRGYQTDKQFCLYPVTESHVLRAPTPLLQQLLIAWLKERNQAENNGTIRE